MPDSVGRPGLVQASSDVVGTVPGDIQAVEVKLGLPFYPPSPPYIGIFEMQFGTPDNILYTVKITRPNEMDSFSIDRYVNHLGKFQATVVDVNWTKLEKALNTGRGRVRFRYGYSETDSDRLLSAWYEGQILSYKIKFLFNAVAISMSGVALGYVLNLFQGHASEFEGKLISDFVKKLAEANDFGHVIEPTAKVPARDGLDIVDEVNKNFLMPGVTPFQFVMSRLRTIAINENGEGNYLFFISAGRGSKEVSKPVLHFHTKHYEKPGASEEEKKLYTFTKFRSPQSPVMDFEPMWLMSALQIFGGNKTWTAAIDSTTKEFVKVEATIDNTPQKMDGGNQYTTIPDPKKENEASNISIVGACGNIGEIESRLKTEFSEFWFGGVKGTLVIQGTPWFELLDEIQVLIYIPSGPDSPESTPDQSGTSEQQTGATHWTSGSYRIWGIHDAIAMGSFQSSYKLVTTGRNVQVPYEAIR